jgi:hypothetical protein
MNGIQRIPIIIGILGVAFSRHDLRSTDDYR